MPMNKEQRAIEATKAWELKMQGLDYEGIAEKLGMSLTTTWRRVIYAREVLKKDESKEEELKEVLRDSLTATITAQKEELSYIDQINGKRKAKKEVTSNEISSINTIKTSSQKIYSFLKGANSDKEGGEKSLSELLIQANRED